MNTGTKVNILLVDDRPDKLLALETIVSDLGQVVKAESGKEAIRQLIRQEFALILLDVNMPGMDGFETAALIRKRASSESTPIIFVTSFNDTETHISRGYSLGAVDYILAPVIPEVLRAKVAVFVDLFRKTEQIKRQAEERIQLEREQAARAAAELAERRAILLAEASRVLASSLDYEAVLKQVALLTVPQVADWCAVHMLNEDGSLRTVAVAHSNPDRVELAARLRFRFPLHGERWGPYKALVTGASEWAAEVPDSLLQAAAATEEDLDVLRSLGLKSYIVSPLVARHRKFGTLLFATAESGRHYRSGDVRLAEDLASRAAVAVDNAMLYHEVEQANRSKDEFLAVISHELRTPLTPILGWTRRLVRGNLDEHERARGIEIIERNVRAQIRLIEDLLDVSRIVTGKLRLTVRSIELVHVIEQGIDAVRSAADAKGIGIECSLSSRASRYTGDPDRLQQVIWNLLSNAIKFTPNGGSIQVSLELRSKHIVVRVADTGVGIDPKFLPFVFERFRQADSTSTRAHGGLGLGLAIVRHLVELHGGMVRAESQGHGKGAAFEVWLLADAESAEARDERDENRLLGGSMA